MEWYELVLTQLLVLLRAPINNTELLWIAIPLSVTLLTMTFYFGLYKREVLGGNTAVGNSIVLLFICVDLLRFVYHYSEPPSLLNYFNNPWKSGIVIAILVEAVMMVIFAFYHILPAKIMYFIASPLPINIQAYVISTIVYTKISPNRYTLAAAICLFFIFFIIINALKILESVYVNHKHKKMSQEVKELMRKSRELVRQSKNCSAQRKKRLLALAKETSAEAKIVANKLAAAEEMQHGELIFAKKLFKLDKKEFMF